VGRGLVSPAAKPAHAAAGSTLGPATALLSLPNRGLPPLHFALHDRDDLAWLASTEQAADLAYAHAGITSDDLSFCEVHDCFTIAEIMVIEALGIAPRGCGGSGAESGATALGGKVPVNPSGGLKSKGHPVGATGIAQVREAVLQLRGQAGDRQVKDAHWGPTQSMGGTGASTVVHVFERV